MRQRTLNLVVFIVMISAPAWGYIDPGTGSLLVTAIISLVMTMAYSLRRFFFSPFARVKNRSAGKLYDFSGKLVFFNEGRNYWSTFKPVLMELKSRNEPFVYLSADAEDPGFQELPEYVETAYLGSIARATVILNSLKADTVVMTTPQLGILQLKRSKYVRHYCHLLHAPVDIHTYKKFAFDDYDSILCSSRFQIKNIRQLEKDRGGQEKRLFETGCVYYDSTTVRDIESSPGGNSILLAPTWGDKSFFREYGEELIKRILDGGHSLIFRPHPQSWISDKDLLDSIQLRFLEHPGFSVDKSPDNSKSLVDSRLMICDLSGIIYDYMFLQKKPVIAVEREWPDGGYESSDLRAPTSAKDLLVEGGFLLSPDRLSDINRLIDEARIKPVSDELIRSHLFNFCNAGSVAAEQILSIKTEGSSE